MQIKQQTFRAIPEQSHWLSCVLLRSLISGLRSISFDADPMNKENDYRKTVIGFDMT